MSTLQIIWLASLVAAGWFLSVGVIRMLAYRSDVDHTDGMRTVMLVSLAMAAVSVLVFVVTSVMLTAQ